MDVSKKKEKRNGYQNERQVISNNNTTTIYNGIANIGRMERESLSQRLLSE